MACWKYSNLKCPLPFIHFFLLLDEESCNSLSLYIVVTKLEPSYLSIIDGLIGLDKQSSLWSLCIEWKQKLLSVLTSVIKLCILDQGKRQCA
jgi:hypothetical protein